MKREGRRLPRPWLLVALGLASSASDIGSATKKGPIEDRVKRVHRRDKGTKEFPDKANGGMESGIELVQRGNTTIQSWKSSHVPDDGIDRVTLI